MSEQGQGFDLVLRGGRVMDPATGLDTVADVAVAGGKVAAVAAKLPRAGKKTLDVSGRLVTPGLIDLHVHVYHGATFWGVRPDEAGRASGTTTMLDAGSAGSQSYRGFKEFIVDRSKVRVLGLVNLSSIGLVSRHGELLNPAYADVEGALRAIEEYPDVFIGAKIRNGGHIVGTGEQGRIHSRMAVEIAERSGTILMTHISNPPLPMAEWLEMLRPGDIVTHCYRSGENNLFDDRNQVIPAARRARERGVMFDVGHGSGSFQLERAKAALEQGFGPDTISTDLHVMSIAGPVYDLPTTMGKMLDLGMSLNEVIRCSTWEPARAIGMEGRIGSLQAGREADIAVLELSEGPVEYMDSYGTRWQGGRRIRAVHTIRAGEIL